MKTLRTWLILVNCVAGAVLFAQDKKPADLTPLTKEVNRELPSWLHFGGEERARMEHLTGEGFKPVADLYLLNRLRLNMDVRPTAWLSLHFQAEDARVFGQNTLPAPASQKDAMDLRVGYLEIGGEERPVTLRAGRQALDFGEGRLVADPNWSNVGKSFDAARVTLRSGGWKVDLFTAAAVKIDPLSFDQPTPGEHFDGAYGSVSRLVPGATLEPYVFWRMEHNSKNEAGKLGNLSEKTAGLRWVGKLPLGFDYTGEAAFETGSWAGDGIAAWTGRWVVGYTLPNAVHKPRFYLEYARASGDRNSKDGDHGTFDPLFPSSHDKYGLTDLFCSSNIVYLRPGFQYVVRQGLTVATAYNDFRLASATDGLYISNKLFARNAAGTAGTRVGGEGDVQVQWSVSRATQLTVGYGRLFAGEFLKRTTTGVPYNIVSVNLAQRF